MEEKTTEKAVYVRKHVFSLEELKRDGLTTSAHAFVTLTALNDVPCWWK